MRRCISGVVEARRSRNTQAAKMEGNPASGALSVASNASSADGRSRTAPTQAAIASSGRSGKVASRSAAARTCPGWDSGVSVNEESEDSSEAPGTAAVLSTILLVLVYVVVSIAAQAYGGTKLLEENSDDVLSVLGTGVFGSPWDKLLIIAVLTSASASTQTTILPAARTTLSMARWRAIPAWGRNGPPWRRSGPARQPILLAHQFG